MLYVMKKIHGFNNPIGPLDSIDLQTGFINVVIETPQGSRNKFAFDEVLGLFRLSKTLAAGHTFPFDFGFIPATRGGDSDPLDVLLLADEPAFPGCLILTRVIGVIAVLRVKNKKVKHRNDRLIGVAAVSQVHKDIDHLDDLNPRLLQEIQHFFVSYPEVDGKKVKILGRKGPKHAMKLIKEGMKRFRGG